MICKNCGKEESNKGIRITGLCLACFREQALAVHNAIEAAPDIQTAHDAFVEGMKRLNVPAPHVEIMALFAGANIVDERLIDDTVRKMEEEADEDGLAR